MQTISCLRKMFSSVVMLLPRLQNRCLDTVTAAICWQQTEMSPKAVALKCSTMPCSNPHTYLSILVYIIKTLYVLYIVTFINDYFVHLARTLHPFSGKVRGT